MNTLLYANSHTIVPLFMEIKFLTASIYTFIKYAYVSDISTIKMMAIGFVGITVLKQKRENIINLLNIEEVSH